MMVETQEHHHGFFSTVVNNEYATLWSLDYDDGHLITVISQDEFSVKLIEQKMSPIFITACMVGGIHWPVTRDAPVIRIGRWSFAFAMPGLLYGLQFPPNCRDAMLGELVMFFEKFAHFEDYREKLTGIPFPLPESEADFWTASRSWIERITHPKLVQYGHCPGKSESSIWNQATGSLRVHRMSTVTHNVAEYILSGALKPTHINIQGMRSRLELDNSDAYTEQIFPSISAFTTVVEAVEMFGMTSKGKTGYVPKQPDMVLVEFLDFKVWTLKGECLINQMKKVLLANWAQGNSSKKHGDESWKESEKQN
ncbi:hypothetical protein F0562_003287 [Nyssa sinensis]|uniref:Uncharacterized protein n=1 Tax=Nyssa sinensis TaxID=561372 RepID=A0A5J5BVL4_9ASTE|nr:hypothetical protein F0562_003287 [Nyssa sinensis]